MSTTTETQSAEVSSPSQASKPKSLRLEFTYLPLVADYLLRWIILELWVIDRIPGWMFAFFQLVGIPLLICSCSMYRVVKLRAKHNTGMIEAQGDGWSVIFSLFVVVSGTFVTYSISNSLPNTAQVFVALATFFVYGYYTAILYIASAKDKLWSQPFSVYKDIGIPDVPEDSNDLRIAAMESEVHSIAHRVESYTLESALFGALSFSGFTTLIASDKNIMEGVSYVVSMVVTTWEDNSGIIAALTSIFLTPLPDNALLGAITAETLIASMFFILVIVSRLRFYEIQKKVNYALALARAWNTKEEETFLLTLQHPSTDALRERLKKLTYEVCVAIANAEPLVDDLVTMARYMWIFRTLGVGAFLVILTTSAFLLSNRLALAFITVAFLAYTYSRIDRWMHDRETRQLDFFKWLRRSKVSKH